MKRVPPWMQITLGLLALFAGCCFELWGLWISLGGGPAQERRFTSGSWLAALLVLGGLFAAIAGAIRSVRARASGAAARDRYPG